MSAVFHGGGLDAAIAKYGGARHEWLDLSTGINPNAYIVDEIDSALWQRLPDNKAEQRLLDAARTYYQVPSDREIVAAPGTQAIIEALPYILKAKQVGILAPTYAEHAHCWEKTKTELVGISSLDDAEFINLVDTMVVVNPNNPTADVFGPKQLWDLASKVKTLIVDEAFCDTLPEASLVPELPDNVIVLKSFGKFFGLAGLRLGFAISNPKKAKKLRSRLGPWAVSGPALEIGTRALMDDNWIANTRTGLAEGSSDLANVLEQSGIEIAGVNPLFVYAKHDQSMTIFEHLASNKILIRPFPEREGYLRFGLCKDEQELKRLEDVLAQYG